MRLTWLAIAGVVVGLGVFPGDGAAQAGEWWDWALRETRRVERGGSGVVWDRRRDDRRGDRYEDRRDRYEDRRANRRKARRGNGPPFCRSGAGHPVHGWEWCRRKGWDRRARRGVRWEDRGWEDIVLGRVDTRRRLDRGGLLDVLGGVILGRMDRERRRHEARGRLEGRWLRLRDGGRVLQVRAGAQPIAELTDLDGDGRVDVVLTPRR